MTCERACSVVAREAEEAPASAWFTAKDKARTHASGPNFWRDVTHTLGKGKDTTIHRGLYFEN